MDERCLIVVWCKFDVWHQLTKCCQIDKQCQIDMVRQIDVGVNVQKHMIIYIHNQLNLILKLNPKYAIL